VYLVSEMASTVTAMHWHPENGRLEPFQTISMLPAGFSGKNTAAELQFDSGGRHLYASNRGDDSIVVYNIAADGTLTLAQRAPVGGHTPRYFALDPSQHFVLVALQDSGQIRVLRRDPANGQLSPTGQSVDLSRVVCLAFGVE
jgi:6-phosphogluconolactonase